MMIVSYNWRWFQHTLNALPSYKIYWRLQLLHAIRLVKWRQCTRPNCISFHCKIGLIEYSIAYGEVENIGALSMYGRCRLYNNSLCWDRYGTQIMSNSERFMETWKKSKKTHLFSFFVRVVFLLIFQIFYRFFSPAIFRFELNI